MVEEVCETNENEENEVKIEEIKEEEIVRNIDTANQYKKEGNE